MIIGKPFRFDWLSLNWTFFLWGRFVDEILMRILFPLPPPPKKTEQNLLIIQILYTKILFILNSILSLKFSHVENKIPNKKFKLKDMERNCKINYHFLLKFTIFFKRKKINLKWGKDNNRQVLFIGFFLFSLLFLSFFLFWFGVLCVCVCVLIPLSKLLHNKQISMISVDGFCFSLFSYCQLSNWLILFPSSTIINPKSI